MRPQEPIASPHNPRFRAALGLEKPALTPNESLQALRVVFAGYKAAETGRTQSI